MNKMSKLNESFIASARRSMFDNIPVKPNQNNVPVVAQQRWEIVGEPKRLMKVYPFREVGQRNHFMNELMAHELDVKHNSEVFMTENSVKVTVATKNIDIITELDKEFARYLDELYRDVVYSLT